MSKDIDKEIEDFLKEEQLSADSEVDQFLKEENPTFEEQYLQPIYDFAAPVAKGLSILGKPVSVAGAAGRAVGKAISGQEGALDPIKVELSTVFPTPEGNPLAGLETIDGLGDPLINVSEGFKSEAPKLAAAVEGMSSPASLIEQGVDLATGSAAGFSKGKMSPRNVMSNVANSAEESALSGVQKTMTKYGKSNLVDELEEAGKMTSISNRALNDKNILKNINNPEGIKKYIVGDYTEVTTPTGKRSRQTIKPGKLNSVGSIISEGLKKSSLSGLKLDLDTDFTAQILKEIKDDFDRLGSGETFNEGPIRKEIESFTKSMRADSTVPKLTRKVEVSPVGGVKSVTTNNPEVMSARMKNLERMEKNQASIEDLVKIKRGVADEIFKMNDSGGNRVKMASDTTREKILNKMWQKADELFDQYAEQNGEYDLLKLNNEYSDYARIKQLLGTKNIDQKKRASLVENILGASAIGIPVGAITDNPYMGLLAGGVYPMARGAEDFITESLPGIKAKAMKNFVQPVSEMAGYAAPGIIGTSSLMPETQPQNSRQPQSIVDIIPRGVPLSDPMMKAAASEYIIKDKSNHPARNADRIMKLMNEGIFED